MKKETYKELNRIARLGRLGTLSLSAGKYYDHFLTEVYCLRFPHIGARHNFPRQFDSLRDNSRNKRRLLKAK